MSADLIRRASVGDPLTKAEYGFLVLWLFTSVIIAPVVCFVYFDAARIVRKGGAA